ncbi:MAG: DUF72 domain-containing protein [Burkholderiales bacterium]
MAKQLSLFEGDARPGTPHRAVTLAAAPVAQEVRDLARQLPPGVRLGTSSWHFPGWKGLVWAETAAPGDLSRYGLAAYARHPLFSTVCVDRAFYAPLSARQYATYARQVPDDFRFVIKAPSQLTSPWLQGENGARGKSNRQFLDATYAIEQFIEPVRAGLEATAGPLLFQFPPLGRTLTRAPERFIAQLQEFLGRLPKGPLYAVEMRDDRIINRRFFASLKETGVRYCLGVHPRMPPVAAQAAAMSGFGPGPLIIRWNLHTAYSYEDARMRFTPFDQLVDEDSATRESIARLCLATLAAGQECTIIANNKAEGSAPLTLIRLAEAIVTAARQRAQAAE